MKAILEFNLPDEQDDFNCAINGAKWREVVHAMDEHLRNMIKHGHDFKSGDEALESCRKALHEELNDQSLNWVDGLS